VIAHAGDVEVALVAVATRGLVPLSDDAIEPPANGERPAWIAREVAVGDTLYAVIDVAALIAQALRGAA
jgi:chemotaxis signal transduction protein